RSHVARRILVAEHHPSDAAAPPPLGAVRVRWQPLHVAAVAYGDEGLHVGDGVLDADRRVVVLRDARAAGIAELLLQLDQLLPNEREDLLGVSEQVFQAGYPRAHLCQLVEDLLSLEG